MLKLYKSIRNYGKINILDLVWAENEKEVYSILLWEKIDKPKLEIEEIEPKRGCFCSVSIK